MRVTIKDVARAANVSVATASMALNNKKGVSDRTRERVKMTAKSLNYVPNQSARSLVTNESNCIGVIVPDIVNPFYSEIVDILSRQIEAKGYTMLLGISNNKTSVEKSYINMFLFRRVAGAIIVPVLQDKPDISHLQLLRDTGIPFVFCTERYEGCEEPAVMSDLVQGQYDAIHFLMAHGISKICFLTSEYRADFTTLRMKGYLQAFQEAGQDVDKNMIFHIQYPGFDQAYEAADKLLEKKPKAIVTINDIMAMGVLKRLRERNIRVPEDVWVVGFDDMKFAEIAQIPITTVRQPLPEMCAKSMELLFDAIHEKEPVEKIPKDNMYRLKTSLIFRETTQS